MVNGDLGARSQSGLTRRPARTTFVPSIAFVALALATATSSAHADAPPAQSPTRVAATAQPEIRLDVEVDPIAYIFSGYSAHVGLGWRSLRLDLGVYAIDLPQFFHGNKGFDASFDGYGAKLQWFPFAEHEGAFIDVSGGLANQRIQLAGTDMSASRTSGSVGIDFGWRFSLPARFYVTTWGGVLYDFGARDVMLAGKTYKASSISPFATVHLGYRFR